MPDPRFYDVLGPVTLGELAALTEAVLTREGAANASVTGVAPLSDAGASMVAWYGGRRYAEALSATGALAVFVTEAEAGRVPEGVVPLVTPRPQAAWVRAARRLHRPREASFDAPSLDPGARLEDGVILARTAVVAAGAEIGRGTRIGAGAVIGPGVAIGRDCEIGAGVAIGFALIGDRVRILANAVIGEAGFGVAGGAEGAIDVPQLGRVILQDDVSVGAATCIDRGAYGDTVIGERTKIDNLVQIAHNCVLGRDCRVAAHTGLAGSCIIGDGVMFGGRAGLADHITVGDRAIVAASAGVMHDIPAGEMWVGTPARPGRQFMRETAWLTRQAQRKGERGTE